MSAIEKVGKIDMLLKKTASVKISKALKRRLQNRRSALKSRMRKSILIDVLTENKNDMQGEVKTLKDRIKQLETELKAQKMTNCKLAQRIK